MLGLPANPLDSLIDLLGGPDHVAEMTGRKARLVRQQGGLTGVKWEARNASGVAASATLDLINVHERQMFLNLEKRIAIISEAASAGISLHADRSAHTQFTLSLSLLHVLCPSMCNLSRCIMDSRHCLFMQSSVCLSLWLSVCSFIPVFDLLTQPLAHSPAWAPCLRFWQLAC